MTYCYHFFAQNEFENKQNLRNREYQEIKKIRYICARLKL